MASAVPFPDIHSNTNEMQYVDTNCFIAWCDKHIGQPGECIMLKQSVFLALNPATGLYERTLEIDDIDRSIRRGSAIIVQLDQVKFLFQAFDDVEKCFYAIEENIKLNKHIFLIVSGSQGKILISALMSNFSNTFVENYWMFVFCSNTNMISANGIEPTNEWAMNFMNNILMENFQDDLLSRMIYEAANYFSRKVIDLENNQRLTSQEQQLDMNQRIDSARLHLIWSKQLYQRYGIITKKNVRKEIDKIERSIDNINRQFNNGEENYGEACD